MSSRPDALYWRRVYQHPDVEYIRLENLHFWPGQGPCVDGYYYWLRKGDNLADGNSIVKRIPHSVWIQWGRKQHRPPEEKHWKDAFQEKLIEPKAYYTGMDKRSKS